MTLMKPKTNPAKSPVISSNNPAVHLDVTEESVRLRAYFLWDKAGRPADLEMNFWLQAETELARLGGGTTPAATAPKRIKSAKK